MREAGLLLEVEVLKELPLYWGVELGVSELISAMSCNTLLRWIYFRMLSLCLKTQAWQIRIYH